MMAKVLLAVLFIFAVVLFAYVTFALLEDVS